MAQKTRRGFLAATALGLTLGGVAQAQAQAQTPTPTRAPRSAAAPAGPARIVIVGDSMSAEYGLARGSGWVALLQERLAAEKIPAEVINASVSGDTSAGGLSRLAALLAQHQPSHVLIELGGNDALRGLALEHTQKNLSAMLDQVQASKAQALLVGMQVPPNYGSDYARRFSALFADVARARKVALVPFLLDGVANAADPVALFQADRIHPNAQAQPIMLGNVWPHLRPLLGR